MRRLTMIASVPVVLCAWQIITASLNAAPIERFPWLSDLDQARGLAVEQGKPLLIVFRCEP